MIENTVQQHDKRLDKIDESIKKLTDELSTIKQKIFNGYDNSIRSTENKVNYIDEQNTRQHGELKNDIKDLSNKVVLVEHAINKLLWKLVTTTFFMFLSYIALKMFGVIK